MENNKWLQTYLYIWVGQFLSMLSSYAVQFAIIIWLSLEWQSAQVLAYAAIAGMLPQAIIGPFAGVYSLAILLSTIGLLFAGLIAEKIGITNTFIISGGLVMLTGLLAFGTPALKRLKQ